MSNSNVGQLGITLLTIAFVVLKLTHVIDWSWWWVLSPLWIITLASIVIVILALIAAGRERRTVHGRLAAYERSLRRKP